MKPDVSKLNAAPRIDCSAGRDFLSITPSGDIKRCCAKNKALGNVKDAAFLEKLLLDIDQRKPWPCYKPACTLYGCKDNVRQVTQKRIIEKPILNPSVSMTIKYDMTYRCPFACPYCIVQSFKMPYYNDLKQTHVVQLSRWLVSHFRPGIMILSGGEPTVHPGWPYLTTCLCEGLWSILLFTNMRYPGIVEQTVRSMSPDARKHLRILLAVHPSQQGFDWNAIKTSLSQIRQLSSQMRISIIGIDYEPDTKRLDLRKEVEFFKEAEIAVQIRRDAMKIAPTGCAGDVYIPERQFPLFIVGQDSCNDCLPK